MQVDRGVVDDALSQLPQLYHTSLPCSITQIPTEPSAACSAQAPRPCWMRTRRSFRLSSLYPTDDEKMRFVPDFVWPLQGEAAATELNGGACASCTFPFRGRSFAYIGLCRNAKVHMWDEEVHHVTCRKHEPASGRNVNASASVVSELGVVSTKQRPSSSCASSSAPVPHIK